MESQQFIPGRELSRQLAAVIEPRLRLTFPNMPLALALIGPGSDVAGYDSVRSMDHDWGPRLTIVVPEANLGLGRALMNAEVDAFLPADVLGFPTRFSSHPDGTTYPDTAGTIHRLHITSAREILLRALLTDHLDALTDAVWLSIPMQLLLEITAGEVFVDDDGQLTAIRSALARYPDHILRYQLAALWMRVAQIQPFIGRAAEAGDNAGSAVMTAIIARDLMRIALLQSGHYAPYPKWLGTAVGQTDVGAEILPVLSGAMDQSFWHEREAALNAAGVRLIRQLNGLELMSPMPEAVVPFHSRPFHVLPAEDIAHSLQATLAASPTATLTPFVGGIDIVTDSTDALKSIPFRIAFREMLEPNLR